jgi:rhodanese-related sulfurtransferase
MGNTPPKYVSYEDVQAVHGTALLISVLNNSDQSVLIAGTVPSNEEVAAVEDALKRKFPIIVYGRNANDTAALTKCAQLQSLGSTPYLYAGGLFEWLLLQDVYGDDVFLTEGKTVDLLRYRPPSVLSKRYLMG